MWFKLFKIISINLLLSLHVQSSDANIVENEAELFVKVQDFNLEDSNERYHQFSTKVNSRYVLIYPYMVGCPIVRRNLPDLISLQQKFKKKDLDIYFLASGKQDSAELLRSDVEKYKIPFPVLMDPTQEIARMLKITRTAEAILIDMKTFQIVYRGPVDDRQQYSTEKPTTKNTYLSDAIQSSLKKRKIKKRYIKSLGCAITIHPRKEVTYYKDVSPVLEKSCLRCHGVIGYQPNNFFTYEGAKNWSTMIKEVVLTDLMPPWEVHPSIHVMNQNFLSVEDKETIYSWIANGMPEGSKKDYIEQNLEVDQISYLKEENRKDFNYKVKINTPIKIDTKAREYGFYELIDQNDGEDYFLNSFTIDGVLSNPAMIQHAILVVAKEEFQSSRNPLVNLFLRI